MRWTIPLAALACAAPAAAEVTGRNEAGFATFANATVAATPDRVWAALTEPKHWWNPAHSWSGNGSNLSLEPAAGGCFCETLPGGGSVEHMRVIYAAPGHRLRMVGALGPLQAEGLAATLTVALEPVAGGTRIDWTYKVGGYTDYPTDEIAPAVDGVMSKQLHRLANFVDRGDPALD
jgi:uncharacterized protein YndB with AHSA1/START domain